MLNQKYPTLSKPPIQTAVFQIGFDSISSFPFKDELINAFAKKISNVFTVFNRNYNRTLELGKVRHEDKKVKISEPIIDTYIFASSDNSLVINITKSSFIFETRKYTTWEKQIDQLREIWSIYSDMILAGGYKVNRASTRFINRIEIPEMVDPTQYFNTTLYAASNVIQGEVDSFLIRYTTKLKDIDIQTHVTQGFEPAIGKIFPFVFDIDVISLKELTYNNLWDEFDILRKVKNKTFFSNLTEKTLNLLL
ncbi:TIGR04255 family protein [Pedobacter sp. Leaf132]|uniref:TIGR04255 family protein n=1 Tax=Pedobacter sp. Leaf132 TaxID=2876557 RepID=UPI001E56B1F4|nr:TIGR04255 family protein [Pedobacter sp. Leaf132]